jgi:hypothetical protein
VCSSGSWLPGCSLRSSGRFALAAYETSIDKMLSIWRRGCPVGFHKRYPPEQRARDGRAPSSQRRQPASVGSAVTVVGLLEFSGWDVAAGPVQSAWVVETRGDTRSSQPTP